jgi:hypothetical protein
MLYCYTPKEIVNSNLLHGKISIDKKYPTSISNRRQPPINFWVVLIDILHIDGSCST